MEQQNFPCLGGPEVPRLCYSCCFCPKAVVWQTCTFALRQIKNPVSALLAGFSIYRIGNFLFKAT